MFTLENNRSFIIENVDEEVTTVKLIKINIMQKYKLALLGCNPLILFVKYSHKISSSHMNKSRKIF